MHRRIRSDELSDVFQRIRADVELPMRFSAAAETEAAEAEPAEDERIDLRAIPFVTIDPPGAMDLDQAMVFDRLDSGAIRLRYAIADVAAFVAPGSALDTEARWRGRTVYCPDKSIPLHPPGLSEGSASLLPDVDRPAVVFEVDLAEDGSATRSDVRRAIVRSRERFDYRTVQERFDADDPPEPLADLERFGRLRIQRGVERGALTLRLPEQEVQWVDGAATLVSRPELPVERWNAEVSLLTGMIAAQMMIDAGVGVLRTLPTPGSEALEKLRGVATSLDVVWPGAESASAFLMRLDPAQPRHLAIFEAATRLLRGAGYVGMTGSALVDDANHGGLGAPYAHVTAPLRRLVDRFTLAACLAIGADEPIPDWVTDEVEDLPQLMSETDRRGDTIERRCIDTVEAWVMAERIGESFEAVVLDNRGHGVEVWIDDPPVMTWVDGVSIEAGTVVTLKVASADVAEGRVELDLTD